MKYSDSQLGRIYILRLEHGDRIPDIIEVFAKEKQIKSAIVHFLGGADSNSKVVVGPEDGSALKPCPMIVELLGTSEALGIGTLFLNDEGIPKLHLHSSFGRNNETITGCTREGIKIWHVGEVVLLELLNTIAYRKFDHETGFEFLEVE